MMRLKEKIAKIVAKITETSDEYIPSTPLESNVYAKVKGKFGYEKNNFHPFSEIRRSLLRKRRKCNTRRPVFKRSGLYNFKRLEDTWRKPRGAQNKLRKQKKHKGNIVKIGYRGPRTVRSFSPRGYMVKRIDNLGDLKNIIPMRKEVVVQIGGRVGFRKRVLLENFALINNIFIQNWKRI